MRPDVTKLIIAVALDVLDFTIGRIPAFEFFFDAVMGVAAVALFGWSGLFAFWELGDPTGNVDAFVPTMTIIALTQMGRNKKRTIEGE